jgi:nucleoside-diphosphate-sugar epimerase
MSASADRVLLTGANGFVAAHIVEGLITQGFHIVGTVRSRAKAEEVVALHPSWKRHITWVCIVDIGATNAYDEAFRMGPFDYIIHNASPVDFTVTDLQGQMIDPAVKGTTTLFEAANNFGGPRLKRIVLSGSTASVSNYFQPDSKARKPWTEADWNEVRHLDAIHFSVCNADFIVRSPLSMQLKNMMLLRHTWYPKSYLNRRHGTS